MLRYKFFPTPLKPNIKNTVGFQYPPEKQIIQQIEIEKIRITIRRLKIKKALKPNKVPNKIIKIYKKIFVPHLQHLFNAYLK